MPEPSPPVAAGTSPAPEGAGAQRRPWALALLLIPFAAVVWPPFFNHVHPTLGGLPFFVWYQLAAVVLGGVVTGVVYLLRGTEGEVESWAEDRRADDAGTASATGEDGSGGA